MNKLMMTVSEYHLNNIKLIWQKYVRNYKITKFHIFPFQSQMLEMLCALLSPFKSEYIQLICKGTNQS